MKILILTKRQYTNKDLLDDQYGRLWMLPACWAESGHDVVGLCLSYDQRGEDPLDLSDDDPSGMPRWMSLNAGAPRAGGLWRFTRQAHRLAARFQPDIVLASSDMIYVVAGRRVAARCGAVFVADLYDQYEIFASARIPGLRRLYRKALRQADLVTCVSQPLLTHVQGEAGREMPTVVVENAIDISVFHPRDKAAARSRFGLPSAARVIGTAGALTSSRGIESLFEAFLSLADDDPDVWLAIAGPRDVPIPDHPRLVDAKTLAWRDVPVFLSALDLGVICNHETDFARYCFPQKAYEMLACGLNVVAADVGVMSDLFRHAPQNLFAPGDAISLKAALGHGLTGPAVTVDAIPTWSALASRAESAMADLLGSR